MIIECSIGPRIPRLAGSAAQFLVDCIVISMLLVLIFVGLGFCIDETDFLTSRGIDLSRFKFVRMG